MRPGHCKKSSVREAQPGRCLAICFFEFSALFRISDIGAHVKPGQLLAEIETPELDQQLMQAKAQLVLAQANLRLAQVTDDRWKELLKTASVSEQAAAEKAAARETSASS